MGGTGTGSEVEEYVISDDIQKVRLLIGDRDSDNYFLTDSDIAFYLDEASDDILKAGLFCCESLISIFGLKVTKKISDQTVNYSDLQDHFIKVADRIQKRIETNNGAIASPSSKTTDQEAIFTREMFANS